MNLKLLVGDGNERSKPEQKKSQRESHCEARRGVGGDSGRRCDSGSHGVDLRKQRDSEGSVHQLQQATGSWLSSSRLDVLSAKNLRNFPTICR